MDKVVHFEIPARDMDRARKFYSGLFGWTLDSVPMPGAQYDIIHTVKTDEKGMPLEPGAINGGLMERSETGPYPIVVIKVKNLDDHLNKIEKAGGKIIQPKVQVGDMGVYARFRDPEGNILGIWQDLK